MFLYITAPEPNRRIDNFFLNQIAKFSNVKDSSDLQSTKYPLAVFVKAFVFISYRSDSLLIVGFDDLCYRQRSEFLFKV